MLVALSDDAVMRIVRQCGFAISVAVLGMTLGITSTAAEFARPFTLAAFAGLLGMVAALVLLPAKPAQECKSG